VEAANKDIAKTKSSTAAKDMKAVERALAALLVQKRRFEPEVKGLCDAYQLALAKKVTIEQDKERARVELDVYTKTVLNKYEKSINRLLVEFHAGFSITKTEHGYPGGIASSTYQILINDTPVELGDEETPLDQPCFRNTLSAGDKSTLALAFFLARLEHDPDRAAKIVLFDDPFNSQDSFRKDHTVRKILDCGGYCAQVLVLSHDPLFLKRLWERLEDQPANRKSLELRRLGLSNTTIVEWDVDEATQSAYNADRKVLSDYYHDESGDLRHVVQKIRPVLEYYTKIVGGGTIANGDTLGVIVGKIRIAGPGRSPRGCSSRRLGLRSIRQMSAEPCCAC
jgi:wobble nucleotide-excising tRNase